MTQAAQLAQYGSNNVGLSFKNRIINGDMTIDQRNAGAAVSINNTVAYTLDRWEGGDNTDGVIQIQQSSTAPTGFTRSLQFTTTTADSSLSATQYAYVAQYIEGFNTSDFSFGTASASTVTLSFWVRSSLTGTFGGSISNDSYDRTYPFTYTISAANTWEQKSITLAGDTSGTWLTNNSVGIRVYFCLGAGSSRLGTANAWASSWLLGGTGSTSVVGTLNATWNVTGVQLEKGSVATSFDYLPYGTELQLCQRYFYKNICATGGTNSTPLTPMGWSYSVNDAYIPVVFPQLMRGTPTLSRTGCKLYNPELGGPVMTGATIFDASNVGANIQGTSSSGLTNARGYWIAPNIVATDFIAFSAEL